MIDATSAAAAADAPLNVPNMEVGDEKSIEDEEEDMELVLEAKDAGLLPPEAAKLPGGDSMRIVDPGGIPEEEEDAERVLLPAREEEGEGAREEPPVAATESKAELVPDAKIVRIASLFCEGERY